MINKKGMTSIELLVSFIIVSIIVVSIFNSIMSYRNKEKVEEIYNEVDSYSNNIQKTIQDDLIMGHLINVNVINKDETILTFDNPSNYETKLILNSKEGIISYGKTDNIIDYTIPKIADLTLSTKSKIEYLLDKNYLKIEIIFNHPNFTNKTYSFIITCPINYIY